MELRQLKHFIALTEEGSFTRAAAREMIVQSGLSASIRGLEREVGASLVRRGSRPVTLTAEGEALLPEARRAVGAAAAAVKAVREVSVTVSGTLTVGLAQTSGTGCRFVGWLGEFGGSFPGLDVIVEQLTDQEMLHRLAASKLDFALTASPVDPDLFDAYPLASTPMEVAVPAGHRLAAAGEVRPADLAGERFVEMRAGSGTRSQADTVFAEHHIDRRIVATANEWSVLIDLVAADMGIALLPGGLAEPAGLIPLRLAGARIEQSWNLVLPLPAHQTPAARKFAQFLIAKQINEN